MSKGYKDNSVRKYKIIALTNINETMVNILCALGAGMGVGDCARSDEIRQQYQNGEGTRNTLPCVWLACCSRIVQAVSGATKPTGAGKEDKLPTFCEAVT